MDTNEITSSVLALFADVKGIIVELRFFQFDALLEAVGTSELLLLIILYCSMVRVGVTVVTFVRFVPGVVLMFLCVVGCTVVGFFTGGATVD